MNLCAATGAPEGSVDGYRIPCQYLSSQKTWRDQDARKKKLKKTHSVWNNFVLADEGVFRTRREVERSRSRVLAKAAIG